MSRPAVPAPTEIKVEISQPASLAAWFPVLCRINVGFNKVPQMRCSRTIWVWRMILCWNLWARLTDSTEGCCILEWWLLLMSAPPLALSCLMKCLGKPGRGHWISEIVGLLQIDSERQICLCRSILLFPSSPSSATQLQLNIIAFCFPSLVTCLTSALREPSYREAK